MDVTFKKEINKNNNNWFNNFFKKIKKKLENTNNLFYYFLILLFLGFLFLISILLINSFTTPFSGDYCAQQFSFYLNGYDDWWHFLKTGEFVFYDTNTYLGVNNIGSNSFYYLFNPFFLPILLFPRSIVPQGMAILTIFKFALAGLTFYFYIKQFKISEENARLTGIMYAFSGWVAWYLWFNHFTEIAVVFPLILLGVEKVLKEKKPYILILSIFLMGITNYFFLFCFCICAFFYAMFRYFQRIKLNTKIDNLKILGIGAYAFISGLLMSMIVVLPSALIALHSDRATSSTYLADLLNAIKSTNVKEIFSLIFSWKKVDYGHEYRIFYPLIEFFFPTMSDRGTPLTVLGNESYDNVAGSLFCFSPCILFFVPALINSFKQKKISHFLAVICFVFMVFTPFFYYLFFGFTKPYSRWYLFLTTSLITYVGLYLDKVKNEKKIILFSGYIFSVLGGVISTIFAYVLIKKYNLSSRVNLILALLLYLAYLSIEYFLIIYKKDKKYFEKMLYGFVTVEIAIMGALTVNLHGYNDYISINNGLSKNESLYAITKKINSEDKTYFRAYSSIANDNARNDGMRNNYNGVSFFHSIYNFNLMPFLSWSRLTQNYNGWSGSYVEKRINLDTFLGIKYYFVAKDSYKNLTPNIPLGYKDISSSFNSKEFNVYENENFIDLGFSFDNVTNYNSKDGNEGLEGNLSSNGFYALRNEDLYTQTALVNYKDKEEILSQYTDLKEGNVFSIYDDSHVTFKELKINHYSSSNPDRVGYDYEALYYHLGDKSGVSLSLDELKNVPNIYDSIDKPVNLIGSASNYVIYIKPSSTNHLGFNHDEKGDIFYLDNSFSSSNKINVYLCDTDGKIFLFDNHNDNKTTSSRKSVRAFYSSKKISSIIIVPRSSNLNTFRIAYQSGSSYFETISKLKTYPLSNVNYKTNHFDFDVDYLTSRMVVTRLAFEDGWKIKLKDENNQIIDCKVYCADGGFVSFVCPKGKYHVELDFYPPYYSLGSYLSIIGLSLYIISYVSFLYLNLDYLNKNKAKRTYFSNFENIL